VGGKAGRNNWGAGHFYGERQSAEAEGSPASHIFASHVEDFIADSQDQSRIFGDRYILRRADAHEERVLGTEQSFDLDDIAVAIEDRLIFEEEGAGVQALRGGGSDFCASDWLSR